MGEIMRYKYKLSMLMVIIGLFSTFIILQLYGYYNHNAEEAEICREINYNIQLITEHVEKDIENLVVLTKSMASTPVVKNALIQSNDEFEAYSNDDRNTVIEGLNDTWMNTTNIDDPFIQDRMTNDAALYLKEQQIQEFDLFGEIFITNKYGAMISTTQKLTTLAHGHKYWWEGSYSNGEGTVYLDDRGFDQSAGAYVLGVVVPVYDDNGEIIGIMKSNYKISALLTDILVFVSKIQNEGEYTIVRPDGLIIAKKDTEPLTESVDSLIKSHLRDEIIFVDSGYLSGEEHMYGVAMIQITNSRDKVWFGGEEGSIDHSSGNSKGAWSVVYTISDKIAHNAVDEVLYSLMLTSSILVLIIAVVSLFMGNYITKPIMILREYAHKVGKGDFSLRIDRLSNDEIGDLAVAFNEMVIYIDQTTITKDSLEKEIAERKELEEKLVEISQEDALTKIYNRRAFDDFYHKYSEKTKRSKSDLALILLDVDNFKKVNDKYGHHLGDEVLIMMAEQIASTIREADIFARWGGEEFVLLLPDTNASSAFEIAERIRKIIMQSNFPTKEAITVSLGISVNGEKTTEDSLILKADEALYQAKKTGKNKTIIYMDK